MAKTGRKPDYILKVKEADRTSGNRVGAGWQNPDGSIALTLDAGVVLDWRMRNDCNLMLFPNDREAR